MSNFSFSQCFLLNHIIVSPFVHIFDIISLFAFELEELKLAYQVKAKRSVYQSYVYLWPILPVCSVHEHKEMSLSHFFGEIFTKLKFSENSRNIYRNEDPQV